MSKSCFNCAHIHQIYFPQTLKEPEFHEWNCGHQLGADFLYTEPSEDVLTDDDKFAEYCAKDCPGYEYFDWAEHEKQQAIAEAEIEKKLAQAEAAMEMYRTTYKELDVEVDY